MGEIGINEAQALHDLDMCSIRQIVRGYRRRERTQWLTTRWLSWTIQAMLGGKVDSPEELVRFSWERHNTSDEDIAALKKMVEEAREYNNRLGK